MPKGKPCKGILKRIKISANGKIKRKPAGKRHLMSNKTAGALRKMRKDVSILGPYAKKLKRALRLPTKLRTAPEAVETPKQES